MLYSLLNKLGECPCRKSAGAAVCMTIVEIRSRYEKAYKIYTRNIDIEHGAVGIIYGICRCHK